MTTRGQILNFLDGAISSTTRLFGTEYEVNEKLVPHTYMIDLHCGEPECTRVLNASDENPYEASKKAFDLLIQHHEEQHKTQE